MALKNQCMYVFNILVEWDELRDSELKGQKTIQNKKEEYNMIENIENIWDFKG